MLPYAQLDKVLLNCLDCFSSKQGSLGSSYTGWAEENEAVLLHTIWYNFVNVVIVKKPLNKYMISNRKGLRLEILVLLGLVSG